MIYGRIRCELRTAEGGSWEKMVQDLLTVASLRQGVIRLVFFSSCDSNEQYLVRRELLQQLTNSHFKSPRPVISLIAQKPLIGELVMELHRIDTDDSNVAVTEIETSFGHYLRIESQDYREIVAGGLCADNLNASIRSQSQQIFEKARQILIAEEMEWGDIVRQWNYLERITEFSHNSQCYQEFNDVRSEFYALSEWPNGYPAATGIGMQFAGVVIDFNAVKGNIDILPLDNDWQTAAHVYSDEVLISECEEKETPKFERGKLLSDHKHGMIYVSGTAAIRGEDSIEGEIVSQTRITVENIMHLIDIDGADAKTSPRKGEIELLRVYLKSARDVVAVKKEMDKLCPDIPTSYLWADVCRDELLIEIEGIAGR